MSASSHLSLSQSTGFHKQRNNGSLASTQITSGATGLLGQSMAFSSPSYHDPFMTDKEILKPTEKAKKFVERHSDFVGGSVSSVLLNSRVSNLKKIDFSSSAMTKTGFGKGSGLLSTGRASDTHMQSQKKAFFHGPHFCTQNSKE